MVTVNLAERAVNDEGSCQALPCARDYFTMSTGSSSPYINRFLSADTIVPNYANPQSLNRYSYVKNSPLNYIDPSGHVACQTQEDCLDMGTTPGGGFPNPQPEPDPDPEPDDPYDPVIIPIVLPCGGLVTCGSQTPYGYVASLLPFTSSDACYFLTQDAIPCNSGTWASLVNGPYVSYPFDWFLQDISDPTAYMMEWGSMGVDFADGMNWLHVPTPIGFGVDATTQWISDSDDNYSFLQQVSRAAVVAGEGQAISAYASFVAGTDGVVGAVTGPADVIIIGGAYLVANAAGSYIANQINQTTIFPLINDYVP